LITVGVAGELFLQSKIGTIETEMRITSDKLVVLVSKEAGSAKTSADKAADAASRADTSAHQANREAGAVSKQAAETEKSLDKTSGVLFLLQKLSEARHIPDISPLVAKLKEIKELKGKTVIVQSYAPDAWGHSLCESLYFSVRSAEMDATDECGRIPYPTNTPVQTGIEVSGPDRKLAESIGITISQVGRLGVMSGIPANHPLTIFVGVQNPFWIGDWAGQPSDTSRAKKQAKKN